MAQPLVFVIGRFHSQVGLHARAHREVQFELCANFAPEGDKNEQVAGLIIRSKTKIDDKFLSFFPNLKVIVTATSGFDHINLSLCAEKSIAVGHVPEAPVQAVAELVFLKILAAARKQKVIFQHMAEANWDRRPLVGREIFGKTLGLVGCGRIGQRVAEMAKAFGLKVQAYDPFLEEAPPSVEMVGYDELLRGSDILTFHVPKTRKTRHMLNRGTLQGVHSEAIIVNTSRGEVFNEVDLITFLRENPEAVAALDVFEHEPLAADSPLNDLNNAILSPHIGASTDECLYQSSFQAMTSVGEFFASGHVPEALPPQVRWWEESSAKNN